MATVDVLIPTRNRPAALAVTLAALIGQRHTDFDVLIADQSDEHPAYAGPEAQSAMRVLAGNGHAVHAWRNLPRRGLAQQRQALLERASAPYVLFLDDDVILEPFAIQTMLRVLREEDCGFVGNAVIGLSYRDDVRPHQQHVEFWEGRVRPERVEPGSPAWARHKLHNAANLWHVQRALGVTPQAPRRYRIAWLGGCVLYHRERLIDCGGFSFWRELPAEHCGEDVLAQLRVMARYGGCGVMPSGAHHQELPTTVPNREVDAPHYLVAHADAPHG